MLQGTIQHLPSGIHGFDCNTVLTAENVTAFKEAGFDGCLRYAPRTAELIPGNLTAEESEALLWGGISIAVVQHCPLPGWPPSAALGTQYGSFGADYVLNVVGIPPLVTFFCDLEEVASSAHPQDVIDYANAWYDAVKTAGLTPGLYVGYGCGLTPEQLYADLKFSCYFRAYNGPHVTTRGYQLIQKTQQTIDGIQYDPWVSQNDNMGDSVIFLSPS